MRELGRVRFLGLAVALLAAVPSLGTLAAPWIAEDASILGRMAREGALGDFTGPQYGLRLVQFFRPVVSASWWLQESVAGAAVLPARLANLAFHALVGVLVVALVRRLGHSRPAALLAGATLVLFPDQGGTVTWIAGRTDLLGALLMIWALTVGLGGRAVLAGVLAFVACATKEFAFVLPAWAAAFALAGTGGPGRSDLPRDGSPARQLVGSGPGALRSVVAIALGVALALVVRRLALGVWLGGYPGAPGGFEFRSIATGMWALGGAVWPILAAAGVLAILGAVAGTLSPGLLVAGLLAGATALAPLLPLAVDGVLEETNRRLLFTAEVGFSFAVAASIARTPAVAAGSAPVRSVARALLVTVSVLVLVQRGASARIDTHEWAASAFAGQARIEVARRIVSREAPAERPVLVGGFPRAHGGAYCLHWGVADRFRPPFAATPRPIWPLRTLFANAASERPAAHPLDEDGVLWPWRQPSAEFGVRVSSQGGGAALETLELDASVLHGGEDTSLVLEIGANSPDATGLEVITYTELGYEPAPLGVLDANGSLRVSLRSIVSASNGVATVGQTMMQAADVGARRAYIELRAVSSTGSLVASSRWIEVVWDDAMAELAFATLR